MIRYTDYQQFLEDLEAETLDLEAAQIVVAVGLQEVETRKISLQQLRNVIRAFKVHKSHSVDLKVASLYTLFRYAAFSFLNSKIVKVIQVGGFTANLAAITREDVRKVGIY